MITDDGRMWIPNVVNTLGNMRPGEGYMTIITQNVTFQYHSEAMRPAAVMQGDEITELPEVAGAPEPTGLPYAVLLSFSNELLAHSPAIIEIYDGDLLVGKSEVLDNSEVTPPRHKRPALLVMQGILFVLFFTG